MNTSPLLPATQDGLCKDLIEDARETFHRGMERCETAVREKPRQSMLAAFSLGTFAAMLPLPAIIASGIRLVWSAAPPALAVIGAASLAERLRRKSRNERVVYPRAIPEEQEIPVRVPEPLVETPVMLVVP